MMVCADSNGHTAEGGTAIQTVVMRKEMGRRDGNEIGYESDTYLRATPKP